MLPLNNDCCCTTMCVSAVHNTDLLMEELMFLPSDAPRHLIPSFSTSAVNHQGELFLREILKDYHVTYAPCLYKLFVLHACFPSFVTTRAHAIIAPPCSVSSNQD